MGGQSVCVLGQAELMRGRGFLHAGCLAGVSGPDVQSGCQVVNVLWAVKVSVRWGRPG